MSESISQNPTTLTNDDDDILALERLLAETDEKEEMPQETKKSAEVATSSRPRLQEDNTFAEAFSYELDLPPAKLQEASKQAAANAEELDSSDDEEVKNFLERKYNEYGCDINKRLKQQRGAQHEEQVNREITAAIKTAESNIAMTNTSSTHVKNIHQPIERTSRVSRSFNDKPETRNASPSLTTVATVFTDPIFGLRIINPLISSALLVERMAGRKAVSFASMAFHTQRGDLSKDWVFAGALVNKSPVRMTQKGKPFSVWRLSDLQGDMKMLSLFLFQDAHKHLWKTAEGMCLAILNATIFEKRAESTDIACLSIDTKQKVMILGQSKDMGVCKARKRNGDACTAIVNLGDCDYCIFHMKQEYSKMSRRSELQSATAGRGLNELRNKVLGKSEVFYGGQSFTAVPAKKSSKLIAKDNQRISNLSEYAVSPFASAVNHSSKPKMSPNIAVPYAARDGPISKSAANIESNAKQRLKDRERLKILQEESLQASAAVNVNGEKMKAAIVDMSNSISTERSTVTNTTIIPEKFQNRNFSFSTNAPQLSREDFCIEVNIGGRQAQSAKAKALQIIKQKPIVKANPNAIRGTKEGKRRAIDELHEKCLSVDAKRQKLAEEQIATEHKSRIERIMNAASTHTNLVDMREQQEQDKYFSKLEKKEALEEKMLNTYKMPCKAVICQQCKYTAFSAAERCKSERHPLKVIDAEKRFFQCKDCGNRTTTVFKLPKISCKNCQSSRWVRTAMIRERKICNGSEQLSIRGNEETFLGSVAGNANLNLLMPED